MDCKNKILKRLSQRQPRSGSVMRKPSCFLGLSVEQPSLPMTLEESPSKKVEVVPSPKKGAHPILGDDVEQIPSISFGEQGFTNTHALQEMSKANQLMEVSVEVSPIRETNPILGDSVEQVPNIPFGEQAVAITQALQEIPKVYQLKEVQVAVGPHSFAGAMETVEAVYSSEEETEDVFKGHPNHIRHTFSSQARANYASTPRSPQPSTSGLNPQPGIWADPSHLVDSGSDMDSEYDEEFHEDANTTTVLDMYKNIPSDDELDTPVRNIVHRLEKAMDSEIDRIVDYPMVFEWTSSCDTFRGTQEAFTGPTPGPVKDYDSPYDAFVDIWDSNIMRVIVNETNRYAKQCKDAKTEKGSLERSSRLRQWVHIDIDELFVFYGAIMFMGIDMRTKQNEYWLKDSYLEMPRFKTILSYNRYTLILRCLHFVDNEESPNYSKSQKLEKLLPVIDHLNDKFSKLYNLHREISLDESLTQFGGALSWIQTIKTKAARYGIKSFELCEAHTGYLAQFKIYTGKESETLAETAGTDLGGHTTQVVLHLLKDLHHRGHLVTMDNFYNSPMLARHLKLLGFDCLGTLRRSRKHVPEPIKNFPKNAPRGTIDWYHCGDVSVLAWKDCTVVSIISTYHLNNTVVAKRSGKEILKPASVEDYNRSMGGIDLKDKKLATYLIERKRGIKWYMKIFKRLLNVSIHNAYVMFIKSRSRRNLPILTHRQFRHILATTLVECHSRRPAPSCTGGEMIPSHNDLHTPRYFPGRANRKRCCVCYRKGRQKMVHSKCATCNVFICFENCWDEWHSLKRKNATP